MKKTILLLIVTTTLTAFGAQPAQFYLGFEGLPLGESVKEINATTKSSNININQYGPLPGTRIEASEINLISINDGEQQFVELTGTLKIPLDLPAGRYTLRFSWKPNVDYPGRQQGFHIKLNERRIFWPWVVTPFNGNKSNNAELTIDLSGNDTLLFSGSPCGNMGVYLDSIWLTPAPENAELSPEVTQRTILTDNP